jgi:hypothetical protein
MEGACLQALFTATFLNVAGEIIFSANFAPAWRTNEKPTVLKIYKANICGMRIF